MVGITLRLSLTPLRRVDIVFIVEVGCSSDLDILFFDVVQPAGILAVFPFTSRMLGACAILSIGRRYTSR